MVGNAAVLETVVNDDGAVEQAIEFEAGAAGKELGGVDRYGSGIIQLHQRRRDGCRAAEDAAFGDEIGGLKHLNGLAGVSLKFVPDECDFFVRAVDNHARINAFKVARSDFYFVIAGCRYGITAIEERADVEIASEITP